MLLLCEGKSSREEDIVWAGHCEGKIFGGEDITRGRVVMDGVAGVMAWE